MKTFVAPDGQGGMQITTEALPGAVQIQSVGGDFNWGNLARDDLNAVILHRRQQLAQQEALARAQMGQQQSQFDAQLGFNREAQRGQEHLGLTQQQLAALSQAAQEAVARQTLAVQGFGQADAASLARQNLALSGFGQAEQLRQAEQAQRDNQALQVANLIASLRGPSNAFKQMEVLGFLNQGGQNNLLAALSGQVGVPAYRAPGGAPEAATLGTMARDAGAQFVAPGGSAGVQGLLALAAQNAGGGSEAITGLMDRANANAALGGDWGDGSPYAQLNTLAREMATGRDALRPDLARGPSVGAQIVGAWQQILRENNGQVPLWDDPRIIRAWMTHGNLSDAQARSVAHFFHEYAKSGVFPGEGHINDAMWQIRNGLPLDDTQWRPENRPGGARGRPNGAQPVPPQQPGTPAPTTGQAPAAPAQPAQPAAPAQPGAPATPVQPAVPVQPPAQPAAPGQAPATGPSAGARIIAAVQQLAASGRMNDANLLAVWQQHGANPQQAQALHQYAKQFAGRLNEGQLNDLLGQVLAGQQPDATRWRQPIGQPAAPQAPAPPVAPQPATPEPATPPFVAPQAPAAPPAGLHPEFETRLAGIANLSGSEQELLRKSGLFGSISGNDDFMAKFRQVLGR